MKGIHKHIGRRVRKSYHNLIKYLYERDTILATSWVFIFIFVLGSIPINLTVLNPIKLALKDFEYNDLKYSKLRSKNSLDKNVVIVNISQ